MCHSLHVFRFVQDKSLKRLQTTPYGSETTSPYWYENINGCAYFVSVVQHPYEESDNARVTDNASTGAPSSVQSSTIVPKQYWSLAAACKALPRPRPRVRVPQNEHAWCVWLGRAGYVGYLGPLKASTRKAPVKAPFNVPDAVVDEAQRAAETISKDVDTIQAAKP